MKTDTKRIEFTDDLMVVRDEGDCGHDAFVVNADEPWLAVAVLNGWGLEYDLDPVDALGELRRYLKACR